MNDSNLYEIIQQTTNVIQAIMENGGELTPELEQALSNIQLQYAEKVDGYQFFIERVEKEKEYWQEKAEYYFKIAQSLDVLRSKLRNNIKQAMLILQQDVAKGNDTKFKLVNHKPKLIIDETLLEPKWIMEVKTLVPDREKIRACLESGMEIRGARLEEVHQLRSYANKKVD